MPFFYELIQTAILVFIIYIFVLWLDPAPRQPLPTSASTTAPKPTPVSAPNKIVSPYTPDSISDEHERRVELWCPPVYHAVLRNILNKATSVIKKDTPEDLQEMFPFTRFSNIYYSQRLRKQLYQHVIKERLPIIAHFSKLRFEKRVVALAESFNFRYHKLMKERGNGPARTIINLLHLLQDLLDIKLNFFLRVQKLNSVPYAQTCKQFPDFMHDFIAVFVSELNMSMTPYPFPIALDHCIVLTIIKAIDVGLAADDYLIGKEDVLKHCPDNKMTAKSPPRWC